jgi:protein TonB
MRKELCWGGALSLLVHWGIAQISWPKARPGTPQPVRLEVVLERGDESPASLRPSATAENEQPSAAEGSSAAPVFDRVPVQKNKVPARRTPPARARLKAPREARQRVSPAVRPKTPIRHREEPLTKKPPSENKPKPKPKPKPEPKPKLEIQPDPESAKTAASIDKQAEAASPPREKVEPSPGPTAVRSAPVPRSRREADSSSAAEDATGPPSNRQVGKHGAQIASAPEAPIREAYPKYDVNPPPDYPEAARRRGYEGRVILRVRVKEDGRVADLEVVRSSGHRVLDRAALQAVAGWRFVPGRRADRQVEMEVQVPVEFRLRR